MNVLSQRQTWRVGEKAVTTVARSYVPASSQRGIEQVIARLYAAGLDLQTTGASRDIPPRTKAMIGEYIDRLTGLMDDLRTVADSVSSRQA